MTGALDLESAVRHMVTAAAANHGDGAAGMTTFRSTQFPALADTRAVGGRLQELGVGYEIGALHMGGGVYVSIANDRRAQEALRRNWMPVGAPERPAGGRSPRSLERPAGGRSPMNPERPAGGRSPERQGAGR